MGEPLTRGPGCWFDAFAQPPCDRLLVELPSAIASTVVMASSGGTFVPIRDSVVEKFLGAGDAWWHPYRELVTLDGLADRLFRLSPTVPNDVTLLRRIDVALWMAGSRSTPKAHRSAAPNANLQADDYTS